MRNYKPQLILAEYAEKMRALAVFVLPTEGVYDSMRGVLLMLAEENKHHREAIDKLQIEVDQLRRRITRVPTTRKVPDEKA